MKEKTNYEALENTSNNKYIKLFDNPTYEDIENAKVLKIAEEKKMKKVLVKKQKESSGFISPMILGALIVILSVVGVILTHIAYLVS